MAAQANAQLKAMDIQALLKAVAIGHLDNVATLLQHQPQLALAMGTVTDLSDRTFKQITVFQYAAWAYDMEMCDVILKHLDGAIAAVQLRTLESSAQVYSSYGSHYDFDVMNKTQAYLDNYNNDWGKNWSKGGGEKACAYWQRQVGGAQRACPAWLLYMWVERGNSVAWTVQNPTRPYTRSYGAFLINVEGYAEELFTCTANGGKLGEKFAVIRGESVEIIWDRNASESGNWARNLVKKDIAMIKKCQANRVQQFTALREQLNRQNDEHEVTDKRPSR